MYPYADCRVNVLYFARVYDIVHGYDLGGIMRRLKGDRVYTLMVNDKTGEEKKRPGTVDRDDIEGWDYTDVKFDDLPAFTIPVLSYFLFDEEGKIDASL